MPGGARVAVGVVVLAGSGVGEGATVDRIGLGNTGGVSGWGWLLPVEGVSVATRPMIKAATVSRLKTSQGVL